MALIVAPATGATVQEENQRVGASSAVSGWNEEAIGGVVQGAAQKTLFERRLEFSVGRSSREATDDEQKQRSHNGAPHGLHLLVSTRLCFLHKGPSTSAA
jgi:hypothetical protein